MYVDAVPQLRNSEWINTKQNIYGQPRELRESKDAS